MNTSNQAMTTILSTTFGLVGGALVLFGVIRFVNAYQSDNPLDSWASAGGAYAMLVLGALFIIVAMLAYIVNIIEGALPAMASRFDDLDASGDEPADEEYAGWGHAGDGHR
jgi:hypothetical protein